MMEGTVDGTPYPIAIGDNGQTLWETIQVAQDRDEVWGDWSLGMGETKQESGRGYFFAEGFDATTKGVLHLSPFYHNDNNIALTTKHGYFMEAIGGAQTITHQSSDTASATGGASSTTTATISDFTVAAGNFRILIVHMATVQNFDVFDINELSPGGSWTCTYDGRTMTNIGIVGTLSSDKPFATAWYLVAPPVTTADVVISDIPNASDVTVGVSYYTGVDPSDPIDTWTAATGTSTGPTVNIVSASSEMVVDVVAAAGDVTTTAGASQTQRRAKTTDGDTTGTSGGSEEAGASSVTMSWTLGSSVAWAIGGVSLNQSNDTVVFVADNDNIFKYRYDSEAGLTLVTTTNVSGGVAGKPAFHNGNWYAPFGSGANAKKLTDVDTPTWANVTGTWKADHLASYQKGVTPTLARVNATTQNTVELNADTGDVTDTWTDESSAVDNAGVKITSLVEAQGQLYVATERNLVEYGSEAESRPVGFFLNDGNYDPENGKGTLAFGDIILYPCNQGLIRYRIGRGVLPVGLGTIRSFRRVPGISDPKDRLPVACENIGEWVYELYNSETRSALIATRLRREGDPEGHEWVTHEVLDIPQCKGLGKDRNNNLWLKGSVSDDSARDIRVIATDKSGGLDVTDRRGQASSSHDIYLDERDGGKPYDLKQLRAYAARLSGDWGANQPLQLKIYRDDNSVESVGSTITASGVTTKNWTVGTNDTAYRARPLLNVTTNSSYDPLVTDPQTLGVRITWRFAEIVRIVIPAEDDGDTVIDIEQNLRRLQNQGVVAFQRPGDIATFNAEIFSVKDTMYATQTGFGHGIELQIRRFVTP